MNSTIVNGHKEPYKIYLIGIVALSLFPLVGGDNHTVLVARFLSLAILALSLDLLWGFSGLLSFGHGAFFGLGAYGLGLTLKYLNFPGVTYLGLLIGTFGPMLVGFILGYFLFYGRVSGIYFGIITLAFTTIVMAIAISQFKIAGGQNGLYGTFLVPKFGIPGLWEVKRDLVSYYANYYVTLIGFVLSFAFCRFLLKRPFGKILLAIKNNEDRLSYLGYNVPKCKTWIFTIACGLAGFAGCMSVPINFVSPVIFGVMFSVSIIIWVAVGGRGSLWGAVIGTLLVNYMQDWLSTQFADLWVLLMGIFFVLVVVFEPDGLVGIYKKIMRRRKEAGQEVDTCELPETSEGV